MYVFHLPMSMEEFRINLSVYAKKLSLDSLSKSNCYIYWLRKHTILLIYHWDIVQSVPFHAIIRRKGNETTIVGLFGISPVLYFLLFILLPQLWMMVSSDYSNWYPGNIIHLITAVLLYVVYEVIINCTSGSSKEKVIGLFQKLSEQGNGQSEQPASTWPEEE